MENKREIFQEILEAVSPYGVNSQQLSGYLTRLRAINPDYTTQELIEKITETARKTAIAAVPSAKPAVPVTDLDRLVDFMGKNFPERKNEIVQLISTAKSFKNKEDVVRLGYEVILFRMELDEWVAFAERLLEQELAEELDTAHTDRNARAKEDGTAKPTAELVKSQAKQRTAPLKEAAQVLKTTRDWMANVLTFCQSQQRFMAQDEYGDLFAASNDAPEEMYNPVKPPSVSQALKR